MHYIKVNTKITINDLKPLIELQTDIAVEDQYLCYVTIFLFLKKLYTPLVLI